MLRVFGCKPKSEYASGDLLLQSALGAWEWRAEWPLLAGGCIGR
jgi:hypothetical protein